MSFNEALYVSEPSREEVLAHLQEILGDRRFASAERNAAFLRYVVHAVIEGKAKEIKETIIAVEVYGRTTGYDPKSDSIVRVEATRLRQKLRSYYESDGKAAPLRISLPSGTYAPRFERVKGPDEQDACDCDQPQRPGAAPAGPHRARCYAVAAMLVLTAGTLSFSLLWGARITGAKPDADAMAAWQEGTALLSQDPHSATTQSGAPKPLIRAIERLEFAVARSPRFAPAWATLAEAYDYAWEYVGPASGEAARRAGSAPATRSR